MVEAVTKEAHFSLCQIFWGRRSTFFNPGFLQRHSLNIFAADNIALVFMNKEESTRFVCLRSRWVLVAIFCETSVLTFRPQFLFFFFCCRKSLFSRAQQPEAIGDKTNTKAFKDVSGVCLLPYFRLILENKIFDPSRYKTIRLDDPAYFAACFFLSS